MAVHVAGLGLRPSHSIGTCFYYIELGFISMEHGMKHSSCLGTLPDSCQIATSCRLDDIEGRRDLLGQWTAARESDLWTVLINESGTMNSRSCRRRDLRDNHGGRCAMPPSLLASSVVT